MLNRRIGWAVVLVCILGACVVAPMAWAMRVSPMVAELSTVGAGAVARIEVGNAGGAAMPYETSITRIEFQDDGSMVETPDDEDFLVFPPQGLVPVGGRQVVRVQWVGDRDPTQSRAYYLQVRQLPVSTDVEAGAEERPNLAVTVLYSMKVLLVVAPPGSTPDVRVVSADPDIEPTFLPAPRGENGAPTAPPERGPDQTGIRVVVANTGTRYALMSGANWIVEGAGADGQPFHKRYESAEIAQALGVGYVEPGGGRRSFFLPTPVALDPAKPVSIRFAR
ncbi:MULTISPECIES: molecular chaperone [Brevundimonas]|uniref:molecular chaperone n=1 Tax=Brevundimonas TaxID=41275 RepID=UPI000E664B61|nr:molecular chaperone [Brevundimonas sp. LPMIX5]RIJ66857.1 molecular chaperone [Brevundimonas sp. LPMIX5]